MKRATGSFEVTLQPLSNADASGNPLLGRMLLTKKFSGDLAADTRGSACYVASITSPASSAGAGAVSCCSTRA
jgi:hypothetical protein